MTATDAAVAAGIASIGDAGAGGQICRANLAHAVLEAARHKIEDAVDRMKTEAGDVPLIAVGGGAFLVPDRLAGISEVIRVPHGEHANAVGAAIAQISGETDQIYRDLSRSEAIAAAEAQARERAVAAGAEPAEPRDRRCRRHAARLSAGKRAARAGAGGGRDAGPRQTSNV